MTADDLGHYECRPNPRVRGLVDMWYVAPGSADQLHGTFSVGRLQKFANAANAYVAEHADPYEETRRHHPPGHLITPPGSNPTLRLLAGHPIEEW